VLFSILAGDGLVVQTQSGDGSDSDTWIEHDTLPSAGMNPLIPRLDSIGRTGSPVNFMDTDGAKW
jgi:hypothetical protein